MLYKLERNLKALGYNFEVQIIDENLHLYRYIVNNGEIVITVDMNTPKNYRFIIISDLGTFVYKSSKGIINRLWDYHKMSMQFTEELTEEDEEEIINYDLENEKEEKIYGGITMKIDLINKAMEQIKENNENIEFLKDKSWGKDSIEFYKDYNDILRIVIYGGISEEMKYYQVQEFCKKYGYFDSTRLDIYLED